MSRNYTVYHLTGDCKARLGEIYGDPGTAPKWQFSAGEEEKAVPVEEPVQEEKKPLRDSGASALRDSGWPPMQEPGALVPPG